MKKATQKDTNPFPNSDSNKRYYTFDYYLRRRFGEKCAKISLDAGFTCPNIDGTLAYGGCIYCSGGSSGAQACGSLRKQFDAGVQKVLEKWSCKKFIPYLQAHTNTYAPLPVLEKVYNEALSLPGAVMLAVATRADCLSDGVIRLLKKTSEKLPLLVELGLQSTNDSTAERIGRGHDFAAFKEGYDRLRRAGGDISICIHLINGLPGEDENDMTESARRTAELLPDMVKIHLLHVLRGTRLCEMYERGEYVPLTQEMYTDITVRQLELLPPDTVVARITGDGTEDKLVAPAWSRKKVCVANDIDKLLFLKNTVQGARFL